MSFVIAAENQVTTPDCKKMYWYDDNSKACGYKQFCGMYMYQNLNTFDKMKDCLTSLKIKKQGCKNDSDCPQPNCAGETNCIGVFSKCTEGKCVINEEKTCTQNKDCKIECIKAPCIQPKCVDGKCVLKQNHGFFTRISEWIKNIFKKEQKICEKLAEKTNISHSDCEGKWTVENNVCKWECNNENEFKGIVEEAIKEFNITIKQTEFANLGKRSQGFIALNCDKEMKDADEQKIIKSISDKLIENYPDDFGEDSVRDSWVDIHCAYEQGWRISDGRFGPMT